MPHVADAFRCSAPASLPSTATPAADQTVVAGNLQGVDNAPRVHASAPTHREVQTFRISHEVLRQEGRRSTELTIDRINAMIMARDAVPIEQWQSAFDMLIACLDLFRSPEGMGLPERERTMFEALFVRPVAAGAQLRDIADLLKLGVPVFDGSSTRVELAEFIGHVQRALGQEPTIQTFRLSSDTLRQVGWEHGCKVLGHVGSLTWRDDATVDQWRGAIAELTALLEFLQDDRADGMGMPGTLRRSLNDRLEKAPAMNGLPLRRVPDYLHEALEPAGRESLRAFLFDVATLLANHAIDRDDMHSLDVLHAHHAFPHDARKAP